MKMILRSGLAVTTLFLSGCASYHASALNNLTSGLVQTSNISKESIVVTAKAFDRFDCKKYLDRDVISKGYQPVQLFIQNNTNKSFQFSLDRISLPHARPEEVAEKVHTSTVGRAVGYGVGALILWPLAVPAIVDGVMSSQANEALDHDFVSKTAKDEVIYPHAHFNRIIFVPISEYQSSFTITLLDQENNLETLNIFAN